MNLPDLMYKLGQARQASQDAYEAYKMHKQVEDEVRIELEAKLRTEGLKSAKNDDYMVSITPKPIVRVTDERAAINWLERQPDVEADLYIGLKKTAFDGLVKTALKMTGEIIPGTEIENNEYLSIRKNKETKK